MTNLITSILQIPADAMPHGDIQATAEIPFTVLEELAKELGAEKLPVHTLSRIGWHYTKADQIIALAKERGLSDWSYGCFEMEKVEKDFRAIYC